MQFACKIFVIARKPSKPPGCRVGDVGGERGAVRRFIEASQRSLDAYCRNPRSGVAALQVGDLDPEAEAVSRLPPSRGRVQRRPRCLGGWCRPGSPRLFEALGCVSGREP